MEGKSKIKYTSNRILHLLANIPKGLFILSIVCGIASGIGSMGLIYLINDALQNSVATGNNRIQLFVGVLLFVSISGLASKFFLIRLAQNSTFKLRMLISRQILATPFRQLEEIGSSRIYSMLTSDIQSLVSAAQSIPNLVINGATLVGGSLYLVWLSPSTFLVTVIFVIIGVLINQMIIQDARRHFEAARNINDSFFEHFKAITFGAKELKLNRLRRDAFLTDELEQAGLAYQENNIQGLTRFALAFQWAQLFFFIVIGWLIYFHPTYDNSGNSAVVGSVLTVIYLMGPLGIILNTLPVFTRADIAAKKIDSLQFDFKLDALKVPALPSSSLAAPQFTVIELVSTTYSFLVETEVGFRLEPIDLVLRPNEVVFLVGGNGSGKSTLLKILTGLYVPENGEIRVNGKSVISEEDRDEYRQLFSVVFSDFHLFERLPPGNWENADTMFLDYIELLQLGKKVNIIDGKFSTILLSQGQRKRLALLSAYLEDRPIYVFDEWAADQDPLFKDIFYSQILPDLRQRGKAVLLATHDDRYFHLADRIIKLDSGRLVSYQ